MNDKNSHPDICNTDHTSNKDEPKVMFVPNITNVNANVVNFITLAYIKNCVLTT